MTTVSVVVPYRGDNGGPRDQAWRYVRGWWRENHPDWDVNVGYHPGQPLSVLSGGDWKTDVPWCKASAVEAALYSSTADILIVADADALCTGVDEAVDAVARGVVPWAVPHFRVHRLTAKATLDILVGGPLPEEPGPRRQIPTPGVEHESYPGMVGGGLVVLPRALYEKVPLDPRFVGFGQEDASWGLALSALAGRPYRTASPLWHLWHPPQPRQSRAVGSPESLALYKRYRAACGSPEVMKALLAEFR